MSGAPWIGSLRHRVTLERERLTPGEAGSFDRDWEVIGIAWAAITPKSSRTSHERDRRLRRDRYEVTLRARRGFAEADRLRWGTETLAVTGCRAGDLAGRFLVLTCERETGR